MELDDAKNRWRFESANAMLSKRLSTRVFILWDKFGSTGRNSYGGEFPIESLSPEVALCEVPPWATRDQQIILSSERQNIRVGNGVRYDESQLPLLYKLLDSASKPPVIAAWYEQPIHTRVLQRYGGQFLGLNPTIRENLEGKFSFNALLTEADVPFSNQLFHKNFQSAQAVPDYDALSDLFGLPFVIQGQSKGGDGTFIIRGSADFEQFRYMPTGKIRISEFRDQQYSTVYMLTVPNGKNACDVYVDIPSYKTTDIPDLNISAVFGAGGDWTQPYPNFNINRFLDNAIKIGKLAYKKHGLIGHWNLEGFMAEDEFYFNELNCRPGGGTEVSSINQRVRKVPPFIVSHYILMSGGKVEYMPDSDDFNHQTLAELRHRKLRGPFYLKVRGHGDSCIKDGRRGSGIYRLNQDRTLSWVRPGISTDEANFDAGEVLLADLPSSQVPRNNGSQLCTIEGVALEKHIFASPHALTQEGMSLAKAAYGLFEQVARN